MLFTFSFLGEEALCKMENNEEAMYARFHFASLFLLIFYAKLFRFIYTRIYVTFASVFQYCMARLHYLRCIFFISSLVKI